MATSIAAAERDVQRAFDIALSHTEARKNLYETEAALWSALLALGRAMVTLFLIRAATRARPATYEHEGLVYEFVATSKRTQEIGTRFGKVPFTRGVGRRPGALRRSRVDLPVDRELGFCGGFSLGTVMALIKLSAMMAFAQARDTLKASHEWAPSSRAALRMVDAIGSEARPFLEQAPPPEDDGEILVIQADGRGAPMITTTERERRAQPHRTTKEAKRMARRARQREHPRPRRRTGDNSKNAKVAIVGVIYTWRKTKNGYEGPVNKQVIGTFESHRALMRWLRHQADKRGYGRKKSLFIADGSEHIWREKADQYERSHFVLAEFNRCGLVVGWAFAVNVSIRVTNDSGW